MVDSVWTLKNTHFSKRASEAPAVPVSASGPASQYRLAKKMLVKAYAAATSTSRRGTGSDSSV